MVPDEIKSTGKDIPAANRPILVLGVGNILLGDEGIGVRVIETMVAKSLPENMELLDGGTAAVDLMSVLEGREKVIIIDAVKGGGEPGALYRFTPDDVEDLENIHTSLHQVGLLEVLLQMKYLGSMPPAIIIIGVEPEGLDWSLELSPRVKEVIPRVIELVRAEVGI